MSRSCVRVHNPQADDLPRPGSPDRGGVEARTVSGLQATVSGQGVRYVRNYE